MESFEVFDERYFSVSEDGTTLTRTKKGYMTAYGGIPMHCDGQHDGVYLFELKLELITKSSFAVGIDEGRTNQSNMALWGNGCNRFYGFDPYGKLRSLGPALSPLCL